MKTEANMNWSNKTNMKCQMLSSDYFPWWVDACIVLYNR